jgi:hypothetical protein
MRHSPEPIEYHKSPRRVEGRRYRGTRQIASLIGAKLSCSRATRVFARRTFIVRYGWPGTTRPRAGRSGLFRSFAAVAVGANCAIDAIGVEGARQLDEAPLQGPGRLERLDQMLQLVLERGRRFHRGR